MCSGSKNVRYISTLVKSILIFRRNPIHFHFVTDENTKNILGILFQTWNIRQGRNGVGTLDDSSVETKLTQKRDPVWLRNNKKHSLF